MGLTYNNKPVVYMTYRPHIDDFATLSNTWDKSHYRLNNATTMFLAPLKTISDKAASLKGTIKSGDTLYFGKTSEFPRFKLSDSDYKRCIKIEKADCVVLGDIQGSQETYIVLEDEINVYLVAPRRYDYVYCNNSKLKYEWDRDWFSYIQNHKLHYGNEIKKIYEGTVTFFGGNAGIDAMNIMNGTYKNLVKDADVDAAINTKLDTITKEDMESICEMLDSPDNSTKGVGLKMLCGYNVNETPLSVRTILGARPQLQGLSEWKSVGVQQVLSTIDWDGFGRFPYNMQNIIKPHWKTYEYSDYDKELCKEVYIKLVKIHMDKTITELTNSGILNTFGVNISYEVK